MPECPSDWVPKCLKLPSALQVLSECPMPFEFPSALECLLSALWSALCMSRPWMSNQMRLEWNTKHKKMFHVHAKRKTSDLWFKSSWNWFWISDFCKDWILLYVRAPLQGLAVGSLGYKVFLVSKRNYCVMVSNMFVLSLYPCQCYCCNLC